MLKSARAVARFCQEKIGWHRIGVLVSLAIFTIAVVVLVRMLHDIDVDDVHERTTAGGRHPAQRSQRAADVEEMVDRLAQQHQIPAALTRIEVLDEPGDRLHTGSPRNRELVGGRVEDGRARVEVFRQYAGDHSR